MINLDFDSEIMDHQKKGYYFKSNNDNYLIEISVKTEGTNCLVTIYDIGIPQRNGSSFNIENGIEIATNEAEYFFEVDLWNKYYFPKFSADLYQWYYDVEEHTPHKFQLKKESKENKAQSMADVMNFAIEVGLRIGKINLY